MSSLVRSCRNWLHFSTVLLLAATFCSADEPTPPAPLKTVLQVELKVVEVQIDKLKTLGFDWETLTKDGVKRASVEDYFKSLDNTKSVDQGYGFLQGLEQNRLAHTLAHPTLATLSGRPTSLTTGTTHFEIIAILLGNGHIRLEYRLEIAATPSDSKRPAAKPDAAQNPPQLKLDSATELEPGTTCVVGHTRTKSPTSSGIPRETETLVLARVEVLNSGLQR